MRIPKIEYPKLINWKDDRRRCHSPDKWLTAINLRTKGNSYSYISKVTGISHSHVYRICNPDAYKKESERINRYNMGRYRNDPKFRKQWQRRASKNEMKRYRNDSRFRKWIRYKRLKKRKPCSICKETMIDCYSTRCRKCNMIIINPKSRKEKEKLFKKIIDKNWELNPNQFYNVFSKITGLSSEQIFRIKRRLERYDSFTKNDFLNELMRKVSKNAD